DLKVPYYLVFEPEVQKLTVFHLSGRKYKALVPNEAGRLAIPELELEVALLEGWVRYWHRGDLLPLPADWQGLMNAKEEQLKAKEERLKAKDDQIHSMELEMAKLREALSKAKG